MACVPVPPTTITVTETFTSRTVLTDTSTYLTTIVASPSATSSSLTTPCASCYFGAVNTQTLSYTSHDVIETINVTVTPYVTVYSNGSRTTLYSSSTQTEAIVAGNGTQPSTTFAHPSDITWLVDNVTLTYPTTYIQYPRFEGVAANSEQNKSCLQASEATSVGLPSSTNASYFIYPLQTYEGGLAYPTAMLDYLDSLATISSQFHGQPLTACTLLYPGPPLERRALPSPSPRLKPAQLEELITHSPGLPSNVPGQVYVAGSLFQRQYESSGNKTSDISHGNTTATGSTPKSTCPGSTVTVTLAKTTIQTSVLEILTTETLFSTGTGFHTSTTLASSSTATSTSTPEQGHSTAYVLNTFTAPPITSTVPSSSPSAPLAASNPNTVSPSALSAQSTISNPTSTQSPSPGDSSVQVTSSRAPATGTSSLPTNQQPSSSDATLPGVGGSTSAPSSDVGPQGPSRNTASSPTAPQTQGSTTAPGSPASSDNAQGSLVTSNSQPTMTSPAPPVFPDESTTISESSNGQYYYNTQVLAPGSTIVVGSGSSATTVVLQTFGGTTQLVVGGSTVQASPAPVQSSAQGNTPGAIVTGSQPFTALNSGSSIILVGTSSTITLAPGSVATFQSQVISAASGGSQVVVGGSQTLALTTPLVTSGSTPGLVVTTNGHTITAIPTGSSVLIEEGSSTITIPNGGVATFAGQTVSAPSSGGSAVVVNGKTFSSSAAVSEVVVTTNGHTVTAIPIGSSVVLAEGSSTLTISNGAAATFAGQVVSAEPSGSGIVVNGQALSVSAASPSATEQIVITTNGHTFTVLETVITALLLEDMSSTLTLLNGQVATFESQTVSGAAPAIVVNGQTLSASTASVTSSTGLGGYIQSGINPTGTSAITAAGSASASHSASSCSNLLSVKMMLCLPGCLLVLVLVL